MLCVQVFCVCVWFLQILGKILLQFFEFYEDVFIPTRPSDNVCLFVLFVFWFIQIYWVWYQSKQENQFHSDSESANKLTRLKVPFKDWLYTLIHVKTSKWLNKQQHWNDPLLKKLQLLIKWCKSALKICPDAHNLCWLSDWLLVMTSHNTLTCVEMVECLPALRYDSIGV